MIINDIFHILDMVIGAFICIISFRFQNSLVWQMLLPPPHYKRGIWSLKVKPLTDSHLAKWYGWDLSPHVWVKSQKNDLFLKILILTAAKDSCMLVGFNCMKSLYCEWYNWTELYDWADYIFETSHNKPYYKRKTKSKAPPHTCKEKQILIHVADAFLTRQLFRKLLLFQSFPFILPLSFSFFLIFLFLFSLFPALVSPLLPKMLPVYFLVGASGAFINYLLWLPRVSAVGLWRTFSWGHYLQLLMTVTHWSEEEA